MTLTPAEPSADPRVTRSRAAILRATAELLIEAGHAGVTIEGVAERAGVAKTTIYRHWKSRSQLLFDGFRSLLQESPSRLPKEDIRESLLMGVKALLRGLTASPWAPAVATLVEASDRDPELRELLHDFLSERMLPFRKLLAEAVTRGELRSDLDVDVAIDMLAGPIFYRRLVSREPLDAEIAVRVVDQFLAGARAKPPLP